MLRRGADPSRLRQLRGGLQRSDGSALVLTLLMIPTLLVLVGLVLDGAIYVRQQVALESAVDAAALAATDAYDREIWDSEQRVVIDESAARDLAQEYLGKNMPAAGLAEVHVDPVAPNQVRVAATATARFAFMPIVGIRETPLYAWAVAKKS